MAHTVSISLTAVPVTSYGPGHLPSRFYHATPLYRYDPLATDNRGVWDPAIHGQIKGHGETWLLRRALGMLARDKHRPDRRPFYDLCLSYSDPVPRTNAKGDLIYVGHVGRIYQAYGSSAYLGRGTPRTHWLTQDGSIVSPRALSKLRNGERGAAYAYDFLRSHGAPAMAPGEKEADYIRRALQEGPFRKMRHNGNHAYAFPCGTHSNRQEIRRRMDKGLPRPTKTDLPAAA